MKKKILAILILVFAIFLCGCEVPPQYTVAARSDGTVLQMLYIPFSGKEFHDMGVDDDKIAELASGLKNIFANYFTNMRQNFVTKLESDDGLSEDDKTNLLVGCPGDYDVQGTGGVNGITFQLEFASALHYYYFNSSLKYYELIEELNKDTSVTQEGIFTNKVTNTNATVFGLYTSYDSTKTFAEYMTDRCKAVLKEETSLTDKQIEQVVPKTYMYRYGTTSRKIHSDADRVRYINNIYYHEWDITLDNSAREISTWTLTINRGVWYVTILGSAFLLIAILFIVAKVKEKKDKTQVVIEEP